MAGRIHSILIAADHGAPQLPTERATLTVQEGLIGDRHEGTGVVSLIEREGIEAFNRDTGLAVTDDRVRRNIVTEGIALNPLVGQRFKIGNVELEAFELCEPCAALGGMLTEGDVSPADVVRHFARSAGIRARVLSDGEVAPGDAVG